MTEAPPSPEARTGPGDTPSLRRLLSATPVEPGDGRELGRSRQGRPVEGYRFGDGQRRVSLVAGCHADEPVGPLLLRHLAGYLDALPGDAPMLADTQWWLVPHANPDGEAANRPWQRPDGEAYDLVAYLRHVEREPPADDVEFGFPRGPGDRDGRPENRAIYDWWRSDRRPFLLHGSLHGMALGLGPWFLLEEAWADRTRRLRDRCLERTRALGYRVHDEDRGGEKGFRRISRGFSTRPDSEAMEAHFRERGDEETASCFRPSSMETVRSLGGDPLTLVPEMPLFVLEEGDGDGGDVSTPVGPSWKREWRDRLEGWAVALRGGRREPDAVRREAREMGLRPMPIRDQLELQWTLIRAGLAEVREQAA